MPGMLSQQKYSIHRQAGIAYVIELCYSNFVVFVPIGQICLDLDAISFIFGRGNTFFGHIQGILLSSRQAGANGQLKHNTIT